jgi:hypothetical protein
MSDEIGQPMWTELYAASLRADKNDLKTFVTTQVSYRLAKETEDV